MFVGVKSTSFETHIQIYCRLQTLPIEAVLLLAIYYIWRKTTFFLFCIKNKIVHIFFLLGNCVFVNKTAGQGSSVAKMYMYIPYLVGEEVTILVQLAYHLTDGAILEVYRVGETKEIIHSIHNFTSDASYWTTRDIHTTLNMGDTVCSERKKFSYCIVKWLVKNLSSCFSSGFIINIWNWNYQVCEFIIAVEFEHTNTKW